MNAFFIMFIVLALVRLNFLFFYFFLKNAFNAFFIMSIVLALVRLVFLFFYFLNIERERLLNRRGGLYHPVI